MIPLILSNCFISLKYTVSPGCDCIIFETYKSIHHEILFEKKDVVLLKKYIFKRNALINQITKKVFFFFPCSLIGNVSIII